VARSVLTQEVAQIVLKKNGVEMVAVKSPEAFQDTLMANFIRQILTAMDQFHRSDLIARLRAAREHKLKQSKERTLCGKPKVTGKKSTLQKTKGKRIRTILKTWVQKKKLAYGDFALARKALTKAKVRTKNNVEISIAQTTTWVMAMRRERA